MNVTIKFSPSALLKQAKRAGLSVTLFSVVCLAVQGCFDRGPNYVEQSYVAEIVGCAANASNDAGSYDHAADMRCRAEVDCRYQVGPCVHR
jgi:hypothetical protein